jgi:hypothetical protein
MVPEVIPPALNRDRDHAQRQRLFERLCMRAGADGDRSQR